MEILDYSWLIVLLPFAAAVIIAFFGKLMPLKGTEVGLAAIVIAWILAILVAVQTFSNGPIEAVEHFFRWSPLGNGFQLELGMYVDGLTSMMFLLVTTVSLMVQLYSREYMLGEERFTYFFAMLSLFTFSMLVLVIANNTLQAIVGWELVGLCSYLLIGFYWEDKSNQDAANKAFLVTKFADVGLIVGVIVLSAGVMDTGLTDTPFNIKQTLDLALSGHLSSGTIILGCLMIFLGAVGKSGQMPLHVWLPDAMAGPTPVSALIHAATMVTAGVFFIARLYPLFAQELVVMNTLAIVGTITLFFAGFVAMVQDDIKKVLAYSTVSQLGYMVAALGVGGYTAGIFHLFTHGFFKALLFLGAGSLIHAVHSNNMSDMGGLRKHMPHTYWTFILGSLALAGFPLTAGFFSKDEILVAGQTWGNNGMWTGNMVLVLGLAGSAVTTFYMARSCLLIFWGDYRGGHAHHGAQDHESHAEVVQGKPHESGWQILTALVSLALLSVPVGLSGGFLWPSDERNFETWTASTEIEGTQYPFIVGEQEAVDHWNEFKAEHLAEGAGGDHVEGEAATAAGDHGAPLAGGDGDVLAAPVLLATEGADGGDAAHATGAVLHGAPEFEPMLAGIALLIFLASVGLAWRIYGRGKPEEDPTFNLGPVTTLLVNKYYLDDLGYRFIVVPVRDKLAALAYWSSQEIIDEAVKGVGGLTKRAAVSTYRTLDQKVIDGGVNGAAFSAAWWSERLKRIQSGNVQRYAAALVIGTVALVLVFAAAAA